MERFNTKAIANIDKIEDIFERKKINSVKILNTDIELNTNKFELIKKEIYSITKTIPCSQIYLTINTFQKKMEIEINPFIGSA